MSARLDHAGPDLTIGYALEVTGGFVAYMEWGQIPLYSQTVFPNEEVAEDFANNLITALSELGKRHPPSTRARWKQEMLYSMGMRQLFE